MAKVDRLGWTAGIAFHAYGLRVGVRVNRAEVLPDIEKCLPPDWEPGISPYVDALFSVRVASPQKPNSRTREYHLLYAAMDRKVRTLNWSELLAHLEYEISAYLAQWARNRIFLHAGVIGWKGKALLLPGISGAGKSSLVTALLRAGATYYSDEFALIDASGYVHPYARRLSLRDGGVHRRCGPECFGAERGYAPLPIGLVALLRYDPRGTGQLTPMPAGRAAMALLDHAIAIQQDPDAALLMAERLVANTPVLRGRRGEADRMVPVLLNLLEQVSPSHEDLSFPALPIAPAA
jgi:hypothetical protein